MNKTGPRPLIPTSPSLKFLKANYFDSGDMHDVKTWKLDMSLFAVNTHVVIRESLLIINTVFVD